MKTTIEYMLCHYQGSDRERCLNLAETAANGFDLESARHETAAGVTAYEASLTAHPSRTSAEEDEVGLIARFRIKDWKREHFLLIPGAVYNANRYPSLQVGYPPRLPEELCDGSAAPYVSHVSRFDIEQRQSRMEFLAGDLAAPCIAYWCAEHARAELFHFDPGNARCETGVALFEDLDAGMLTLDICAPGVRSRRYRFMDCEAESKDRGIALTAGQSLDLKIRHEQVACADLDTFYRLVLDRRQHLLPQPEKPVTSDLAAAFREVEAKYNRENWLKDANLYLTNPFTEAHYYQNGWCGGLLAAWPLLESGSKLSRDRATRMFRTVLGEGICESGLFYSKWSPVAGGWVAEGWNYENAPHYKNFALIRRQGDTLYYGLKMLDRLERQDGATAWASEAAALLRNAETLQDIWQTAGEFGQFVDQFTGRVTVGGSACGAVIPAALALASERFERSDLLATAAAAMRDFDERFLQAGVCTGGIGDALQAPDSESTAALLESAMALYRVTGEACWLAPARRAAEQAATWVMPYDYAYPESSIFGQLDMKSTGTVFANVQNKHSAPGICTHSGVSLAHLSEATGDPVYRKLFEEIALAIPQHVSTKDRPIRAKSGEDLPPGWINERVNTSDWDDNVGGVFYGPCWCEISLMLTYAESRQLG